MDRSGGAIILRMLRPYHSILPRVHPTAFIDDSAQVIGDVEIGDESSVWMHVVIRGDVNRITIGRRTNIQDGTVIHVTHGTHPTRIGDEVTVGHAAVLHGCTVGNGCLIGMGAIVLDGAEIGEASIVGAGALVLENMTVPPRSLVVGRPAVKRRDLTEAEIAGIRESANRYVGYREDYR
jgi:carbonic anhydrase/acetyltransferase-like protein (isoleucine patch superfamily)